MGKLRPGGKKQTAGRNRPQPRPERATPAHRRLLQPSPAGPEFSRHGHVLLFQFKTLLFFVRTAIYHLPGKTFISPFLPLFPGLGGGILFPKAHAFYENMLLSVC